MRLYELLDRLINNTFIRLAVEDGSPSNKTLFGIDMTIEGLRSQQYSVGIFVFLIVSLVLFGVIIWMYMPKGKDSLKTGEKIMFGAIIAGVFIAIAMGYLQLIDGYLL